MYDVAIIGAGPAGVSAAIYAARYRLKTVLISPEIGGWASKAHRIENLPGHLSVLGKELKQMYTKHVEANELEYVKDTVITLHQVQNHFELETNSKRFSSRHIIFGLGTKKRMLNVPGESEYLGKGVCLCATCDAPFFKNKAVAVIGGNDSGATSALLIAEYAKGVTIIEMLPKLPAEPIWQEKIQENEKIQVITSDSVREIRGSNVVESILLHSGTELAVDGVFIEIGQIPDAELVKKAGVELDKWGHIVVDSAQQTNVDRFYAAGDITTGSNYMRQIVAAQAEGAIAAQAIYKRILKGE